MAIIFKKDVKLLEPAPKPEPKVYKTFAEVISQARNTPQPVSKQVKSTPEKSYIAKQSEDSKSSGLIKPKYVEDKSVLYKSSSYLKELLGEGD